MKIARLDLGFGIWVLGFALALIALSASGCAKAQAASVPNGPPLDVPSAPARVLAPVEEAVVAAPTPAPETAQPVATAPVRPPVRPPVQPAPPAAAAAPPAATPPADNRELRATPTTNAATERSVRDLLAQATRDLNRVNRARLSADGQANFDQARRFSQQAEQALKERNVAFAATLADKAALLAAELVGR